jgi:hypothetical protein
MNAVLTAADKKWRTASKSKARKTEQEALNWISSPTAGTLTLQDDSGGASAGKNQVRPASLGSVRMSECDFQSQLRAPLKAVGTYHYVHLDGAPP